MNSFDEKWKCPNCDTFNTGRRCVVCGQERKIMDLSPQVGGLKSTMPEMLPKTSDNNEKSHKGWIIALIVAGCILLVVCVFFIIDALTPDEKNEVKNEDKTTDEISEQVTTEEEIEEEEKFLVDSILNIKFRISNDVEEMEQYPGYGNRIFENMVYAYPKNFKKRGGNRYIPVDNSAYLSYEYGELEEDYSLSELMNDRKAVYKNNIFYEASDVDWFVISTEYDGVIYYEKTMILNREMISMIFAYPKEYKGVYDGYVEILSKELGFCNIGEVVIIEE